MCVNNFQSVRLKVHPGPSETIEISSYQDWLWFQHRKKKHDPMNSRVMKCNLQQLQAGETTESSVCNEAHTVVSHMELVQQAKASKTGLLQSGQAVGGEVTVGKIRNNIK